ncbi:MAG TPA: DUF4440 domain-containing protein [Bryobacteraceae bacterium]|jgi:ketosteroid isomerase-like protein|nr:DUF4440 domain-containing protein [Bryobacteraceae bacterium]
MAHIERWAPLLLAISAFAQSGAIDPRARKDIDAGNQAWVNGMKTGDASAIAATYAGNAVDCAATGECVKGRAAIEAHVKERLAKMGRAVSASAATTGSVQQGDFVYEWGHSEVAFAAGPKTSHRYLTVWQRQPGGDWKIFRNLPIPDDAPR